MTAIQEETKRTLELPVSSARTFQISRETLAVLTLAGMVVVSRLWMLGARVMSHDESLHVYYSWLLSKGQAFAHNPMMHGPLLFEATALVNWFLGANDFPSRLVPVLAGVFIAVAMPHWRPQPYCWHPRS
jgi:predicted membrane-bound mannosyltransferase